MHSSGLDDLLRRRGRLGCRFGFSFHCVFRCFEGIFQPFLWSGFGWLTLWLASVVIFTNCCANSFLYFYHSQLDLYLSRTVTFPLLTVKNQTERNISYAWCIALSAPNIGVFFCVDSWFSWCGMSLKLFHCVGTIARHNCFFTERTDFWNNIIHGLKWIALWEIIVAWDI